MALWPALSARWNDADPALDGDVPPTRYGVLKRRVEATGAWLADRGIGPGDVVAVQLGKERAFLELFLASAATGAVFLPINPRATDAEVGWIVQDARARLVVREVPEVPDRAPVPIPPPASDAIAVLLYTSGTTGRPKGVPLSHRNVLATVTALHDAWGFRRDDVLLHALPLFHVHGLFVAQLVALWAGARTRWHRTFDPERVLADLPGATVFMGVPTFYERLLAHDLEATDLSGVRLFTSGSAGLPPAVHTAFQARTGHAILERYGMTEVGIVLSNPLDGPRRPGRVGGPLPGVEARVADGADRPVEPGVVGELHVRGPSVFAGYHRRPDATAAALAPDGWMRTGDLAVRWPDGTYSIVGRRNELILTGGFNVAPREVEEALLDHPAVAEAAVFGVPDRDAGQRVTAAVVLREPVDEGTLQAHVRRRLSGYKVPRQIVVRSRLPRNAMGKVEKHVLAREHAPIAVRPATEDDVPWLVAGNRAMAEETEGLSLDEDVVGAGVRRVFTEPVGARYLVAEIGGEPVGQLMLTTEWSDWRDAAVWWIQSVYVWPAARRRGVFRALYDAVVAEAREAGAAGVRLYVDTRNTTAQAVYRRLGMCGDHYRLFEDLFDGPPGGAAGPDGR